MKYFVKTVLNAQSRADKLVDFTMQKTKYFNRYRGQLNDRQLKVINRMLEESPKGFKGGMNARKYFGITRTSKATSTIDLQQLLEIGAFKRFGKAG